MTKNLMKLGVALSLFAIVLAPLGYGKEVEKAEEAKAGTLEEQMVGYWAPDTKQMLEMIIKQVGDDPNAQAMIPMMEAMMANMAVEIKKGEVAMHGVGPQAQKSTYQVTKVDAENKTLNMMVKDANAAVEEEGTAKIDGDKLTLAKDGEKDKIVLNRIDKAEFEKRKAAGQQVPGLPIPQ